MLYNGGGLQVFYDWKNDPEEVPPRFIADILGTVPRPKDNIYPVKSVDSFLKSAKTVFVIRNFALGDVLLLIPVMRELREKYPNIRLMLGTRPEIYDTPYITTLANGLFDVVGDPYRLRKKEYDVGVLLDGVLERDHRMPKYSSKHRVDIYRDFFNLKTGQHPSWAWGVENVIGTKGAVFASGGRNPVKQLNPHAADYIDRQLRKRFKKVLHVREELFRVPDSVLLETIRDARVLVTMDSAPLWIGHFYNTPTVLLTGPTRGSERLTYHPLYPEGVHEVSMSHMIACEPCFESRKNCRGNIYCMSLDGRTLWPLIEEGIEEVMWKNR